MAWFDVAMILFACVAANHLGLISAIEGVVKFKLPIINCTKCAGFWCTLAYLLITRHTVIVSIAASFLCAALAPWLNLLMGFFDTKFNWLYDKIYSTAEDEPSEGDSDEGDTERSVS